MMGCCCGTTSSCTIANPPTTTVIAGVTVSDAIHPNASVSGWTPRGMLQGFVSLSTSTSEIDIIYQWLDASNYDYLKLQRVTGTNWQITSYRRRTGTDAFVQQQFVTVPTATGAQFCVSWNGSAVTITIGDATGSAWSAILSFLFSPIINAGRVGVRRVSPSGSVSMTAWYRHRTEGPIEGEECPSCFGDGPCAGCCVASASTWLVDLRGFNLTNQNFTGCTAIPGQYVIDPQPGVIGECQWASIFLGPTTPRWEYQEPQINFVNCRPECFAPYLRIVVTIKKVAGVCTLECLVTIAWASVGVPCDTCLYHVIARYSKTSPTVDALCSGAQTLAYVNKDPLICNLTPPATITITGTI